MTGRSQVSGSSKRGQDIKTLAVLHQHVQGNGVGPQFFCLCESLGSRLGHGDLILTPQKVRQQFPQKPLLSTIRISGLRALTPSLAPGRGEAG